MKAILLLSALTFYTCFPAQEQKATKNFEKKGSYSIYWGWNRSMYTNSDISFTGDSYNFMLEDVEARDRQSPFETNVYFNPRKVTIPQYNLRIGYFISDKYEISIGVDHMKYVMRQWQESTITGTIANSGTGYDGTYNHTPFQIRPDFLLFEHTDGLNYINSEIRRFDKLYNYKKLEIQVLEGVGAGILMPRTNATLLNNERNDEFHLAGFGLGAVVGLKIEFYKRFYVLSELKAGYINMPDIRTTKYTTDRAKQQFCFLETDIIFGVNLNTMRKLK